MDAPQLELFDTSPEASSGRVVIGRRIDLGSFGNLTLLIVVDGSTVKGVSCLVCDDPKVEYFNYLTK